MASVTDGAEKEADGWQKVTDKIGKETDRAEEENNEPKEVGDASLEAAEVCNAETNGWQKEMVPPHKVDAPLKKVLAEAQSSGKVVKSNPR